ncbi:MAG: GNAT family N-acetyltransferase [Tannerella sp.]|jgi:predicted acetyltransferase|nr:GNAT family N-acetyltransferase [Tannerella sp.]
MHSDTQHPLSDDRHEIMALWQETFRDSDAFVDLFFHRVFKPENTLVVKRNNRIISALQMIPCEVKVADSILSSAYVCGVCTLPTERGKGIMHRLMADAMNVMRRKGYILSVLIPAESWLFDFYRKFGYIYPVSYTTEFYSPKDSSMSAEVSGYTFTLCTAENGFPYFDRKQRERRCAVLHNVYDFETILRDLICDHGSTWIALKENKPAGIAFAKLESGSMIRIKEMLYDDPPAKKALVDHLLHLYHAQTAKIHLPFKPGKSIISVNLQIESYGLACALDKQNREIADLYMSLMLD